MLGFSFKAGTDDLRESPMVEMIERLIGKGYDLRLYDRQREYGGAHGANRDYILNHIPHIARLMVGHCRRGDEFAEVIVIGNGAAGVPVGRDTARARAEGDRSGARLADRTSDGQLRRHLLVSHGSRQRPVRTAS